MKRIINHRCYGLKGEEFMKVIGNADKEIIT